MNKLMIGGASAMLFAAMTAAGAQPAPPPPPGVAQGTAPMMMTPPPRPGAPQMHMMVMPGQPMTRGEVAQHVAKLFARLDANRDSFVTRDEVETFHSKMMAGMEAMSRGMHAMGTMPEMPKMPMLDRGAMFDRLDTNHDGSISRQEYMAAKPRIVEKRVFRMGDGAAPGGLSEHPMMVRMRGPGEHMKMGMGGFGAHLFEMADANHDGRVSLQEAQAAALAHFDRADLNHDGRITPDERQQMRQVVRIERRGS